MSTRAAWAVIAILVVEVATGIVATLPPAAVSAAAPIDAFSSGRAMVHVRRIADAPHPVGTAAHHVVRNYLISQLQSLGMTVEIQRGTANGSAVTPGAALENIIGSRPGIDSGRAVALVAHYDVVPGTRGAGDDATGVAAILETLRAIGPTSLPNELVVVFTDGEELGLQGARLFVASHPRAKTIGVALNFDARGNAGPSFLFQTSPGNGALIREVARAAPHPRANSLTGEVYRRLPNDTDLSVFLRDAPTVHGLNFAFIDGFAAYHTSGDTPDALDERTLQHQGSYALSLARRFGSIDLSRLEAPDAVYFNAPLLGLVHYPESWAIPLSVVVVASLLAVIVTGRRRGMIRGGVGVGAIALVVAVVASTALAFAGWRALMALTPGESDIQSPLATSIPILVAKTTLAAVITGSCIRAATRRASAVELSIAPIMIWALLGLVSAAVAPGASWIFTWPAAFAVLALAHAIRPGMPAGRAAIVGALAASPAFVLIPPILWQLQVAMTNQVLALCAGVASLALMVAALPLAHVLQKETTA